MGVRLRVVAEGTAGVGIDLFGHETGGAGEVDVGGEQPAGAVEIAGAELCAKLVSLDLGSNNIGDLGARALANSTQLQALTTLNLSFNGISPETISTLKQSGSLQSVRINSVGNR